MESHNFKTIPTRIILHKNLLPTIDIPIDKTIPLWYAPTARCIAKNHHPSVCANVRCIATSASSRSDGTFP